MEMRTITDGEIHDDITIQEEPVLNSGNPKWLIVQTKKTYPVIPGRPITDIIKNPLSPEIVKNFTTKDPCIWTCRRCGGTQKKETKPFYCENCKRDAEFDVLTKKINTDRWKLPIWKDIPIEDLNMLEIYYELLDLIKSCIVFPEVIQYDLLALWIIASYKVESFNTIPFLIFRGLIESGKTRGLDILRELGYRMVHTSGVSFPAMCRLTHFHHAGVLIDEIDGKIITKWEDGRKYLDFLKPSYRKGSTYTVADTENQEEIKTYKNFGFKAFAGETGGYDAAIFSRSLDFQMQQAYPEIPDLMYVQDKLNDLQTKLINYRYKFNEPDPLPLDYPLKGRDREIFSCLIRTAGHIGLDPQTILDYVEQRDAEKIETIQDSDEYQILKVIKGFEEGVYNRNVTLIDDAPESISYGDISEELGWEDTKRRSLGHIIRKKLLLKTKRRGNGYVVLLNEKKNQERLKMLYRRFHV